MDYSFHIDEVFEMACQMEDNGAAFYQEAAQKAKDPETKALLEKLAAMEVEHKAIFNSLRQEIVDSQDMDSFFDPQGEGALYLKSIVDTKVFFEKKIDTSSLEEVFKEAIWAEKDSAAFYLGIRLGISEEQTKKKIDTIIEEEMSHIRILSERLRDLKKD